MIVSDGYYVMQVVQENKIIIGLPQTMQTIGNTIDKISDRRLALTDEEEASLLLTVRRLLEQKEV